MGIRYNIVPTKVNLEEIEEIQKLHEEVEEEKGLDAEVWEGLLQEAKRIENGFRNIEKVQLIKEEND